MLRAASQLLIVTLCATAVPTIADVYKYVDENGQVQYTDKPQTLPAERLKLKSRRTDTVELQARQDAEQKRMEEADKGRQGTGTQQADQRVAAQTSAKDKADRCAKARERYDNYMNSQRLYEALPNGERRYLSEDELKAARAAAKVTMDELCK